jgi:hypothetical protein
MLNEYLMNEDTLDDKVSNSKMVVGIIRNVNSCENKSAN